MSIALDGFAVFKVIGTNSELFKPLRVEIDKQARAIFSKSFKSKEFTLDLLRAMYAAIGKDNFELLTEGMKDTELKTAVTKFDRYHPDCKSGSPAWRRQHLLALATGGTEALASVSKAKKKSASEPGRLSSKLAAAYAAGGTKGKKKKIEK